MRKKENLLREKKRDFTPEQKRSILEKKVKTHFIGIRKQLNLKSLEGTSFVSLLRKSLSERGLTKDVPI
jgi:hypothetical protein